MRVPLILTILLLAAPAFARAANDVPSAGAWELLARSALLRELQTKRPEISQWELQARISDRQREQLVDVTVEEVVVTLLGARSTVRLRWRVEGRQQMTTVWFATQGFGSVFVAKEKLSAHASLSPDSGQWSVRDVMGLRCSPILDGQMLSGMRTKLPVQIGEPICRDKIEPVPLVGRGGEVTVQSFSGPVVVTGKAIAQADGQLGAKLKVKSSSSGIVYSAIVTGQQQVSVYD